METKFNYYNNEEINLYLGDSFKILELLPAESFDMIFADPPYFLSNNGITCQSGEMVSVNKAEWDMGFKIEQIHDFNVKWLKMCKRLLKPNGTIWISGTMHNIYSVGLALQELDYRILNNITWRKLNPPPNLSCRFFTHSTETILWASKGKKAKHYFDYQYMKKINGNKQMKDVWDLPAISKKEKIHGKHPTQKPEKLLERIVLAATKSGDKILDPFNGSGTTGVVAVKLGRSYVGIDLSQEYLDLTIRRLESIKLNKYGGDNEARRGENQATSN
jgi:site-specific DNA-methyltransferase (adenine-specific)